MLTERETVEFVDRGQSSGFGAGGLPRLVKGGDVVFDVLFGYGVRFVDAAGFEPINVFGDVGFVGGDGGRGEPSLHADVDEEQLWQDVSAVTAQALDRFVEMRAAEGAKMKADVESRLVFLEQCVGKVESLSAGRVENYTNRLYEKLKVILEDRDIDDARVLTEAAIFGDKTAVDEETVRLRSHISQYRGILQLNEPVGRKLDFLTQELNRETNTIGSKCQDLDITRIVVDMKAEIEKIREQIQNLE